MKAQNMKRKVVFDVKLAIHAGAPPYLRLESKRGALIAIMPLSMLSDVLSGTAAVLSRMIEERNDNQDAGRHGE